MTSNKTLLTPAVRPKAIGRDHELLDRIQKHVFDKPGTKLTFAARLARENGWPQRFAERVVEEYRRFVYLACIAEHEVTPSEEVDQAWHLHLAYSRNYWEEFCPNVLRRALHHGPTAGGPAEGDRYRENYGRTLALYKTAFGKAPPVEIWPPEQIRFGHADGFVRVDTAVFSVRPRPGFAAIGVTRSAFGSSLLLIGGAILFLIAFKTALAAQADGSVLLPVALGVVLIALMPVFRRALRRIMVARPSGASGVAYHQPQHGYVVNYIVPVTGLPFIDVVNPPSDGGRHGSGGGCGGAVAYGGCSGNGSDGGGGCGGGGGGS